MRNLWWDGFFAESSETIWLEYLTVYVLVLGGSVGLVGVIVAMSSLLAATSMWPGALFAERTRRYKFIVLLTGGGLGRIAFLALAAIPWIATGNAALGIVVVVAALRGFLGSVAMPAWNAFAAEFVPARLRGRYFASRNLARQLAGLVVAPLVGFMIFEMAGLTGWQVAWLLAFVLGFAATGFYQRIPSEVPPAVREQVARPKGQAASALRDGRLVSLMSTTALFQLSVMIAGPFFSVYLIQHLGGTPFWVGMNAGALAIGGIISQGVLGKLNDRFGPKWLLVTSGLLMPVAPWLWIVISQPWHVMFINLIAGAVWSANLLSTFNMVLAIAPEDRRPTYSGFHQAGIFFASFIGPLTGGWLISMLGFHAVFFLSGAGRLVATLLLWRTVHVEDEVVTVVPATLEAEVPEAPAAGG